MLKIRWFKSIRNGQFYFNIKANNNIIIASSEGYKKKVKMMKVLHNNFPDAIISEEPK